jgi:hypothetical protein
MSVLVTAVIAVRLAIWLELPRAERDLDGAAEVVFFAIGTVVGAVNDWNSVTRHRVYDYGVSTDLPRLSLIPLWMLLYWGLILRFMTPGVERLPLAPRTACASFRRDAAPARTDARSHAKEEGFLGPVGAL